MKLPLDERQLNLCAYAAKVEECFVDCGKADRPLIDEILGAGFLRKTKSRTRPYEFTDAGCIAVALWHSYQASLVPPPAPAVESGEHDPFSTEKTGAAWYKQQTAGDQIASLQYWAAQHDKTAEGPALWFAAARMQEMAAEIRRLRSRTAGGVTEERVEASARAIYDIEPFYMPTGTRVEGVEIARKFSFDDAPAYRQEDARRFARAALAAQEGR